MRILSIPLRTTLLLGAVLLTACGSQSGPKEVPPGAGFAARILDDGTKLFTVTLQLGPPEDSRARIADDDCFRCQPGERPPPKRERAIDMKGIATALIAENRYCRDGFLVLEQFPKDRSQILRGECRDSADASDRARFGKD